MISLGSAAANTWRHLPGLWFLWWGWKNKSLSQPSEGTLPISSCCVSMLMPFLKKYLLSLLLCMELYEGGDIKKHINARPSPWPQADTFTKLWWLLLEAALWGQGQCLISAVPQPLRRGPGTWQVHLRVCCAEHSKKLEGKDNTVFS